MTGPSVLSPAGAGSPLRPSVESTYTESVLRRSESVFFISLPFTALYSMLLTGAAALAIERGDVRNPDLYLGISMGTAALASGLIAWRDARSPKPVRLPSAAPESGTILLDSPR